MVQIVDNGVSCSQETYPLRVASLLYLLFTHRHRSPVLAGLMVVINEHVYLKEEIGDILVEELLLASNPPRLVLGWDCSLFDEAAFLGWG